MQHRTAIVSAAGTTAFCAVMLGGVMAGVSLASWFANAPPASRAVAISVDQAAESARLANPGAQITRTPELVNFRGTLAYEVMLDRGPAYVHAATGRVIYNPPVPQTTDSASGVQAGSQPGGQNGIPASTVQQISRGQAAQIASAAMNGARPSAVELRLVQGYTLYDVTFADGAEMYIDPQTGQILASQAGNAGAQATDRAHGDDDDDDDGDDGHEKYERGRTKPAKSVNDDREHGDDD